MTVIVRLKLISPSFSELTKQLKAKDDKIMELQKEIYELKLEKIEGMKKDLQEKLSNIVW